MMTASLNTVKRINYTLSDGLIATSAKLRKNSSLAIVFITDLDNTIRVVLDTEAKKVISSEIQIAESDLAGLVKAIKG